MYLIVQKFRLLGNIKKILYLSLLVFFFSFEKLFCFAKTIFGIFVYMLIFEKFS